MKDYYRILQVDPLAEQEVIDAAYRRLARKYHPDNNKSADATRRMQEINEAYEVLRDPIKRREYDRGRATQSSGHGGEDQRRRQQAAEEERRQQAEKKAEADRRTEDERRRREQEDAQKRETAKSHRLRAILITASVVSVILLLAVCVLLWFVIGQPGTNPKTALNTVAIIPPTSAAVATTSVPNVIENSTASQTYTPTPAPAFVSMTTETWRLSPNTTFLVTLNVRSPNQGVEAADFVVDYDPSYLKVTMVSGGNYFGVYPVKSAQGNQVRISGMAELANNTFLIPIGDGVAGIITFQTLSTTGRTKITFDREKTIVASKGENILDPRQILDLDISIE